MAIDTREKRFAMLNFTEGLYIHAQFEADGAIDADDRAHLLDLYGGIALDSPSPVDPDNTKYIPVIRRRRRM
ncbi:hypothetical protein LCGC14_2097940 [marine sediment metagenome]|uniref:Uncharacterized protein n=1 Tax=marine sediment metagenome TaxID=412755 RepID=A0A0F9EAZ8_9ZZZZ